VTDTDVKFTVDVRHKHAYFFRLLKIRTMAIMRNSEVTSNEYPVFKY